MESIGSRIIDRRKELGLKAKELARRVGCHPPDVSDWEKGKTRPNMDSLFKLARALETTETWLVSGGGHEPGQNVNVNRVFRKFPVDNRVGDTDNNPVSHLEAEMLRDKDYIIALQKEKIRELEERVARLEGKETGELSKKSAG